MAAGAKSDPAAPNANCAGCPRRRKGPPTGAPGAKRGQEPGSMGRGSSGPAIAPRYDEWVSVVSPRSGGCRQPGRPRARTIPRTANRRSAPAATIHPPLARPDGRRERTPAPTGGSSQAREIWPRAWPAQAKATLSSKQDLRIYSEALGPSGPAATNEAPPTLPGRPTMRRHDGRPLDRLSGPERPWPDALPPVGGAA